MLLLRYEVLGLSRSSFSKQLTVDVCEERSEMERCEEVKHTVHCCESCKSSEDLVPS